MTRSRALLATGVAAVVIAACAFALRSDHATSSKTKPSVTPPAPAPTSRLVTETAEEHLGTPEPAGTLRLEGQVIAEDDAPVAGVTISIDTDPARTTTSEADGTFVFEQLQPRRYHLIGVADGATAGPVQVRVHDATEPVILRLTGAAGVTVEVVEAGGDTPIADASVELRGQVRMRAPTDPDGLAHFGAVPPGDYTVVADGAGFARGSALVIVAGASQSPRVRIALARGVSVAGTIVDAGGRPVGGALVSYRSESDWVEPPDPRLDAIRSDDEGRFRFDALAAGTYYVRARAEGHAPGASAPLVLDGKVGRDDVVVRLGATASVAGVVVDRDGAPVPSARIELAFADPGSATTTYSDEHGAFAVRSIPRATATIVAVHDRGTSAPTRLDLAVTSEVGDLRLVLGAAEVIAGLVVDAAGEPVEGAQVQVTPVDADPDWWELRGSDVELTDAGGHFEVHGLAPGAYRLKALSPTAIARGFAASARSATAQAGDRSVRLTLAGDGSISGRVRFDDGAPAELFVVRLFSANRAGLPFASSTGEFVVPGLPAGDYRLSIEGPGIDTARVEDVTVVAGERRDVGDITVGRGRAIRGRVVDAAGTPVAGAAVFAGALLFGSGQQVDVGEAGPAIGGATQQVRSDAEGRFVVRGAGFGKLSLIASLEGKGRSQPVVVAPGTEAVEVRVVLEEFGAIDGTVTRGGAPAPGALVTLQAHASPLAMQMVRSGPDGKFRVDRIAPGTYTASAIFGNPLLGTPFYPHLVDVAPGQTATAALAARGGTAALEVTPEGSVGGPVAVFVSTAALRATDARQLADELGQMGDGEWAMAPAMPTQARFEGLSEGKHTACAVRVSFAIRDMNGMLEAIATGGHDMPVRCATVVLRADATTSLAIPVTD